MRIYLFALTGNFLQPQERVFKLSESSKQDCVCSHTQSRHTIDQISVRGQQPEPVCWLWLKENP